MHGLRVGFSLCVTGDMSHRCRTSLYYSWSGACNVENVSKVFGYCESVQATVSISHFSARIPSQLMKSYCALSSAKIHPVYLNVTQILIFQGLRCATVVSLLHVWRHFGIA